MNKVKLHKKVTRLIIKFSGHFNYLIQVWNLNKYQVLVKWQVKVEIYVMYVHDQLKQMFLNDRLFFISWWSIVNLNWNGLIQVGYSE